ncbi:MAG TPA: Plug domain-containing protein, partial [Longimicrobiales bacterium]|nr:Plug domain-containing protein [Longimicrobiales bacterium]
RFVLDAPGAGSYYLAVRQAGWQTLFDGPYDLGRGSPLEVEAVMHPLPFAMDSVLVRVEGKVGRLAAVGFYERQRRGFGRFLEREEIEATAGRHLTDALRRLPRVAVVDPRPVLGRPDGLLNPQLYIRTGGELCTPTLYLDGIAVATRDGPLRPDDYLTPGDVEAVEVYAGPSEMPAQYSPYGACAVVLVWSRHTPIRR